MSGRPGIRSKVRITKPHQTDLVGEGCTVALGADIGIRDVDVVLAVTADHVVTVRSEFNLSRKGNPVRL